MRPPAKRVGIGPAWREEDFQDLLESLIIIAQEEGIGYAREILDHGYRVTMMTEGDYHRINHAMTEVIAKGSAEWERQKR